MVKIKVERTVAIVWHPAILHAIDVVDRVWRKHVGIEAVVSGAQEVGHSDGSLHYGVDGDIRCRAVDIRTWQLIENESLRSRIEYELFRRLPELEYDVIFEENSNGKLSHLHIEFQPKWEE